MKIISTKKLGVSHGDHIALENVDLSIFDNDFIGIIGPNGGGKTSLIKAILGLVPYVGTIEFSQELSTNNNPIGYLPQINNFDRSFPISVRDVVVSGLQGEKSLKFYSRTDYIKASALLEMVGVSEIANKSIGSLSGGQLQRVLLCRALISEPKLLILDEPANFVDNKFEKELYAILKELNKKMAIIMVSHDLGTISSVVKTIVCVNRHVHRHESNKITAEQLQNYDCPIQIISHGQVPHTVLSKH